MPGIIKLDSDATALIDIAFDVAGKLEISKDKPQIIIPITGELVLDFSNETDNSLTIIMELKK